MMENVTTLLEVLNALVIKDLETVSVIKKHVKVKIIISFTQIIILKNRIVCSFSLICKLSIEK